MRQITLKIGGMSCDHCVGAVRAALSEIPSVQIDSVALGSATLRFDPSVATVDRIVAAIDDVGYQVLEPVPW